MGAPAYEFDKAPDFLERWWQPPQQTSPIGVPLPRHVGPRLGEVACDDVPMHHENVIVCVFDRIGNREVSKKVMKVREWSEGGLLELIEKDEDLGKVMRGWEDGVEKKEGGEGCGWKRMSWEGKGMRVLMLGRDN